MIVSRVVPSSRALVGEVVPAALGCGGPIGCTGGAIVAICRPTGKIKWSLLIGSFEDKCMRALNASNGRELWRFNSQDFISLVQP